MDHPAFTQLARAGQVHLLAPGLFEGIAGQQGDQLSFFLSRPLFVPGRGSKPLDCLIDGEPAQIMVTPSPTYSPRTGGFLNATLL